ELVLHLHGLDNHETLSSRDLVTRFDENAHNPAGHRGYNALLTGARGFTGSASPGASALDHDGDADVRHLDKLLAVTAGRHCKIDAASGVRKKKREAEVRRPGVHRECPLCHRTRGIADTD